ncbi:hypothetical protein [Paraburkholderia sp. RL17-337-BIB-A]|uniref:hypothetical protein n=1 Tax=Paraburkholderia sp. RL17-337-BIB-A TaxID=3031636 RepID=UPI0038BBEE3D
MAKLPTFDHNPPEGTVTVTHHNYAIRDYAEIRSGQLTALLSLIHRSKLNEDDMDMVIVHGLAEDLAREVSGLVELFTRTDCLEASCA